MKYYLYALRDSMMESFNPITASEHDEEVMMDSYKFAILRGETSKLDPNLAYMDLYAIGTFDNKSGITALYDAPRLLMKLDSLFTQRSVIEKAKAVEKEAA